MMVANCNYSICQHTHTFVSRGLDRSLIYSPDSHSKEGAQGTLPKHLNMTPVMFIDPTWSFLLIEMFQQQIMQKTGKTRYLLQIFWPYKIFQLRPSPQLALTPKCHSEPGQAA